MAELSGPPAATARPVAELPATRVEGHLLIGVAPSDLSPLPPVEVASPEAVRAAVGRARAAAAGFRELPEPARLKLLQAAAKSMLERRGEAIELVSRELGKTAGDALFTEGLGPVDALAGWARVFRRAARGPVRLNPLSFPGKSARVDLVPRGVVGVIAPWNFPIAGLYRSVWPALLAGNGVVVKPSEHSPRSASWFVARLAEHLPEGLVATVVGGPAVGEALLDGGIDACVFTGSPRTGRGVQVRCAERGIPCSAELGGNDAAIVLPDCDLDRTVAGITHWALQNAGQSCGAVEVVLADSRIARKLADRLADAWGRLRHPRGQRDRNAELAPLATRAQLALVLEQLDDAVAKGAEVLTGGRPTGSGYGLEPTVLFGCTDEMRVVREETFGPVLPIVSVDGPADAVRRVNADRYGLTASIWTRDLARAARLAEKLEVGVVTVNNHSFTGAITELPWSGTRDSGSGVANSVWSLLTFARPRAVVVDRSSGPEPYWMPFDDAMYQLGDLLADAQLGRIGGLWRLPGLLSRRARTVREFFRG